MLMLNTPEARAALRMHVADEEMEVRITHQGRIFDVTFLSDEDGTKPSDPSGHQVTEEQAKAWERGEWWYHHVMVHIRDHDGSEIDDVRPVVDSYVRLQSFIDPHEIIERLCNELLKDHPF